MYIKLDIIPPTITAQEHKIRIVKGRPMFYDTPRLKEAKKILFDNLSLNAPDEPLDCPIELMVRWNFTSKSHKPSWKTTKPDTDNLQKLLKDVMTKCGYWVDDSRVAREVIEKRWEKEPSIEIWVKELKEEKIITLDGTKARTIHTNYIPTNEIPKNIKE